ncbi:MAG: glycosyltransferase [Terracidiphilus sp.]|jgi:glycosyltransferase involved in cell wall biosynthesis
MIRALFVMSNLGGGGAEISLLELLSRLDRTRVEPSLFLLKHEGVHLNRVGPELAFSWACEGGNRFRYNMPRILWKALKNGPQADVIVGAMEGMPSYFAFTIAMALRKPLVGWVRTDLDKYLKPAPDWHRRAAQWIYSTCDAVVVPSNGSAHSIQRVADVPSARLHQIHNIVDSSKVISLASEPVEASAEVFRAKPYILGVGRLNNAQKGFDLLVRAHALVRKRGIDHNLVVIGEGEDRAPLQQLARSLKVEESFKLPGFYSNPFPFFQTARALAAPARLDGFGRIFLEAMSIGLPVIGSPASGPTEILDKGTYGIVVPNEDVAALADAMCSLLTNDQLHAHYAKLSIERARHYDPAIIVSQWERLLCSLLKRKGPTGPLQ